MRNSKFKIIRLAVSNNQATLSLKRLFLYLAPDLLATGGKHSLKFYGTDAKRFTLPSSFDILSLSRFVCSFLMQLQAVFRLS